MHTHFWIRPGVLIGLFCSAVTADAWAAEPASRPAANVHATWRGVHVSAPGKADLPLFKRAVAEGLAPIGVNVLVLEVNYHFAFQSHPELTQSGAMDKADAHELAALCRKHKIRLIPLFNCLGHQSWARTTLPLLSKYPEFDETPQIPPDNKGIYCRSWCPAHSGVNAIVFALMDELIDAFETDALHVGMDEVFLIANDQCPRCKGKNPARLFAKAVNDCHGHLVGKKRVTMLMWGDRLLDEKVTHYGKWESSDNGTSPAIDLIPKDIVVCDWNYEAREDYPSIQLFQKKGFRVWPASWKELKAAEALMASARRNATDRMLGHLCTNWTGAEAFSRVMLNEGDLSRRSADTVKSSGSLRACMASLAQ